MINARRLWAIFKARNNEFFRDREAFGWNFLFPFLLVVGFSILFGGDRQTEFKIGVFPLSPSKENVQISSLPDELKKLRYIRFIWFDDFDQGLERLLHHKIDLLLQIGSTPYQYWMSDSSPNGYIAEKIVIAGLTAKSAAKRAYKQKIYGRNIRYLDWLFPGILGMNMMFSALYGVGFVVVRYRKNGVLKRLKATPLTAFEYLTAQMLSRIFLLMFTLIIVWIGCDLFFHFHVEGSYLDLLLVFLLGGMSLTALGLVLAARGTSEEFTNGVLNFITWPMMFLSEVWFSIEGAPLWVKTVAEFFPVTHMLRAVRSIMNDGAGLMDLGMEMTALFAMTLIFLSIGAAMFSWNK
jgi:ABC-type multidrug transport system permease subunit